MRKMKAMFMSILALIMVITSAFTPMPIAMAADNVFYVSSSGSDDQVGTEAAPFATLNRALTEVTGSGTIVLLSNLTLNDVWTVAASGKTVIITSAEGNRYSILRDEAFKNRDLIRVSNGNITFENVNIDGNHVIANPAVYGMQVTGGKVMFKNVEIRNHDVTAGGSSTASVIAALGGTVVIQDGSRVHHNRITGTLANNPPSLLGAGSGGVVEIQEGIITENEISAECNGVIVGIGLSGKPRFIMTGGQITGNILSGNGMDVNGQTIGNVAVYMRGSAADARFDFGGTAYVYDNLNTSGEQRNVYLKNTSATGSAYLTLISPLQAGAKVGVYANIMPDDEDNPVVDIAIGGGNYQAQPADQAYFVSDINTTAAVAYDSDANKVVLTYRLPVHLELDAPSDLSTVGATPTLKGSVTVGATVSITMVNKSNPDKNVVGEAIVGPDGKWEFTPSSAMAPGEYTLRVDATNNGISAKPIRRDIIVVDKSALQSKQDEIKGETLEESLYTPESWAALQGAVAEAEQVLNDVNATQTQVDKALQELTSARAGLTLVNDARTSGPGGVGNPVLWLLPDGEMGVSSGAKVNLWNDRSSKGNHAVQEAVANQPTYWDDADHNINFNPVLAFDGSNSYMNLDVSKLPQGKSPRSIVAVSRTNRTSGISYIISWGKSDPAAYSGMGLLQNRTRGGLTTFNTTMDQTLYTAEGFLGTASPNEQLVTWTGGNNDINKARLYSKMKQVQELNGWGKDNTKLWDTGDADGAAVGKLIPAAAGGNYWQGTIEEIIVYDRALTDEERQKVSTYLAIKYGYTMDQTTPNSYVDSSMNTIWDSHSDAAYTHRITSIGRDDLSGLMQKQAKSQEQGSILTMALGDRIENTNSANTNELANNSSFFTFGDNGANADFSISMTKDEEKLLRMERLYKVQKTNWNEAQITLQVDTTGGGMQQPRYLVISDDEQVGTQHSFHLIENGKVTLNTSNFGPHSYFTFATAANPLTTPDVTLTGDELNWEVVEHADQYQVTIQLEDGTKRAVTVDGTTLNLSLLVPSLESGNYTVTVTAKTNNPAYSNSAASTPKSYVVVDKTKLKAEADEINGKIETGELNKEQYTPASWTALDEALNEAKQVLNDTTATQAQVDKALQDLTSARSALTKINPDPGVDKTSLQNKYDGIQEEHLEEAAYTPESWITLHDALNEAERVLNDTSATQAQVDKALQDLTSARIGLSLVNGEEDTSVLETLVPSTGSLSPAFDPTKDTYAITVPNSVYQLQLTPTALHPQAKIEILVGDGEWAEVSSGVASHNLPLQVGGNTVVVKVTDPLGHVTKYRINATRMPASDSNNGGGGDNSGGGNNGGTGNTGGDSGGAPTPTAPTPIPTPAKDNLETTRDGSHQPFAASKSSDSNQTLVQVDPAKLNAAMSQGTGQQFAIHSPNGGDMQVDGLTLETLNQLTNQGSKLNISNLLAIYPVPGSKMDMNAVSKQLGDAAMSDIAVRIDIARSSDALISNAKNKAAADGYELLVNPVDLDLTFTKDGQTVRSELLNGYAPKYIALPEGIDPNRITTGVIINPDGSIYHVPTVVTKIDSRYYALINDLRSSGSYSVIWNPQDFDDVRTHWGKADVNNIAARLDLKGNGDNTFSPNRQVTRSEFAELVVLSLGLMRQDAPQNKFPDIQEAAWFRSSVALANDWGIVKGYNDGNFYGNQQMTREQGFAMIARAYRLVNPEAAVSAEQIRAELDRYNDAAAVSAWAQEDIAQLIQAGIIQGSGRETLHPQATMTRAEVAALLARMLKVTDLIDK